MGAARKDITVEKGATFSYRLEITNKVDATAFNLTGYTAQAEIRESAGNKNLIVAMTGTISSPTTGVLLLTIAAVDTASLREGIYEWDLFIRATGSEIRLLAGKAMIAPSVSKRP
jgi:hypothetical protein